MHAHDIMSTTLLLWLPLQLLCCISYNLSATTYNICMGCLPW